jgi:hypothetical protein
LPGLLAAAPAVAVPAAEFRKVEGSKEAAALPPAASIGELLRAAVTTVEDLLPAATPVAEDHRAATLAVDIEDLIAGITAAATKATTEAIITAAATKGILRAIIIGAIITTTMTT